ncbi:hypothetical protein ACET3Z_018248 [Daucus carota]
MFDYPRRDADESKSRPRNHTYADPYLGWKIGKESEKYENDTKLNGGVIEFRTTHEHGICSPPLWENQGPAIESDKLQYSLNLSPTSRREAVNRGRLELMEMVKAMPESSYELSLKDLVENFQGPEQPGGIQESAKKKKKKINNKAKKKSGNMNENNKGMFLKMVELPFGGGASRKKKVKNPYARVVLKTEDEGGFDDKEWWNKIRRWSVSDQGGSSGSGGSSRDSIGSTRSKSTRDKNGCFSGFQLRKTKSAKCI